MEENFPRTPRPYQVELYNAAKKRNTIVCLGTGTGKTFIAVMLIKDPMFAAQLNGSYLNGDAKRTIFLVPTRPLVKQQAKEISEHFECTIGDYTGDKNVDYWNLNKWQQELEENQVLVMTPQIFLDMLNHNYIHFSRINLLIIDEVHWGARKKGKKDSGHPYKQIMTIYHQHNQIHLSGNASRAPFHCQPRVLGLSASLINSAMKVEQFDEEVKELERTFCSVCNTSSFAALCGTNPREIIWQYVRTPSLVKSTASVVRSLETFIIHLRKSKKAEEKKKYKQQSSGGIGGDDIGSNFSMGVGRIMKCLINIKYMLADSNETLPTNPNTGHEYPQTMSWMGVWCANVAIDFYTKEFNEYFECYKNLHPKTAEIIQLIINFLVVVKENFKADLSDCNCAMKTCSPKMTRLLEILKEYKPIGSEKTKLCGVIFVNRRSVAKVLCEWLCEIKRLYPAEYGFINVSFVVGQASRPGFETLVASYSNSQQQEVIQQFRDDELNLLVATSVLEEGLDVRQCNVVIRYDKPKTFREYLQSKGRARAVDACYYLMSSSEDSGILGVQLNLYQKMEEKIKMLNRNGDKVYDVNYIDSREDNNSSGEEEYSVGDARVTTRSAVQLLNRYCQRLPTDAFTKLLPEYTITPESGKFKCSVLLPVNCPLKGKIINGELRKSMKSAKQFSAFEACKELHKIGELDDRFLPISQEVFIEKYVEKLGFEHYSHINFTTGDGPRTGTRNMRRICPKKVANEFTKTDSTKYYLHSIRLNGFKHFKSSDDYMSFGAITANRIQFTKCSFYMFTRNGKINCDFVPVMEIKLSSDEKFLIEKFHEYTFREVLGFQCDNQSLMFDPIRSQFSLSIVPLMSNKCDINWNFIRVISEQNPLEMKAIPENERKCFVFNRNLYEDCVFYRWYPRKDSLGMRDSSLSYYTVSNITDLTPLSDFPERKYRTFEQYFLNKHNLVICNTNQNLIEGEKWKFAQIRSFFSKKDLKATHLKRYFVPELCSIHPFPSSLYKQAFCIPLVLYRLNCLFLSENLRKTINFETGIGNTTPDENSLILNEATVNEELTANSEDASDDDCDGHPYDADIDYLDDEPQKKKLKTNFSIPIVRADNYGVQRTPLTSIFSSLNNISVNKIEDYVNALILQFDFLMQSKNAHNFDLNAIIMQQLTYDGLSQLRNNTSVPSFGESFPFLFTGDISPHILESYDAKVSDPIAGPNADIILNALTLLNSSDNFNLERLETVGDSFLKFVTTVFLYNTCPELDEGRLTYLRMIQICNCNLYHTGEKKRLSELMVATKFEPKLNWLPPNHYTSEESDAIRISCQERNANQALTLHMVSDKSVADSIEALIGAHLIYGGIKSAILFMQWLGLKVSQQKVTNDGIRHHINPNNWLWFPPITSPFVEYLSVNEVIQQKYELYDACNLSRLEERLGYVFKTKEYLIQALTHSSYYHNRLTDCYQRLEFLGDAVLDYLITRHIYKTNPNYSPGELTDLRSALVNNTFFASIVVKYGLHTFLKHLSPDLFRAISMFITSYEANKIEVIKRSSLIINDEEVLNGDPEQIEVPKALGDIFESLAGAVYLDNGLSLDGVWRVFFKLLKPEIDYFSKNVPKMPVRELRDWFPNDVKFSETQFLAGRKIRVTVKVKGKKYAGVGCNKHLAKIAASKSALKALKPIKEQK